LQISYGLPLVSQVVLVVMFVHTRVRLGADRPGAVIPADIKAATMNTR
jgi:hypothetical protein